MENKKGLTANLKRLSPITGIVALLVLSFFISWNDVWQRFKEVNIPYLIPSALFTSAFVIAETLRLRWVLGTYRLEKLLRIFSLSRLVGIGTVHLAGEGILLGALKLSGFSLKSATIALLQLRCLDLGVICLVVGIYGNTYFSFSISIIGFGLIAVTIWKRRNLNYLREVILSSLFMYLFFALSVIASAKAVRIDIGKIDVIRVSAVSVLSQVLPVTPLGLGTRDLSLIALLSSFGVSREKALVFSWIEFIVVSVISLSLIYILSFIFEKMKDKNHTMNKLS
ncbi:MAG: flippase-like domain-containing protein [Deltaproteobacteria bacterium]|nr:flippase-like domain-containing protein [Deltaproteobacteria bacterium]